MSFAGFHQPCHLARDRGHFRNREVGQRHLEMPKKRACVLIEHRLRRGSGEGCVDIHQIARLGAAIEAIERFG